MGFIELYDGSCFKSLQLVYTTEKDSDGNLKALHNAACIEATDIVRQGFQKEPIELDLTNAILLGDCPEDYPMQHRQSIPILRIEDFCM